MITCCTDGWSVATNTLQLEVRGSGLIGTILYLYSGHIGRSSSDLICYFSVDSICRYYRCISSNDCANLAPEETVNDRNFSTPYPADPADDGWNTARLDLTEDWTRAEPGPHPQCCENLEEGWRCRPDLHKCHRYVVNDETALSADVGFMFDFQVKSCHLKCQFLR